MPYNYSAATPTGLVSVSQANGTIGMEAFHHESSVPRTERARKWEARGSQAHASAYRYGASHTTPRSCIAPYTDPSRRSHGAGRTDSIAEKRGQASYGGSGYRSADRKDRTENPFPAFRNGAGKGRGPSATGKCAHGPSVGENLDVVEREPGKGERACGRPVRRPWIWQSTTGPGAALAALLRLLDQFGAAELKAAVDEALKRDVPHFQRRALQPDPAARPAGQTTPDPGRTAQGPAHAGHRGRDHDLGGYFGLAGYHEEDSEE